uniref:PIPK domain-containing protein n=1 Tax=Globodera pallida TaxID=36090 RepID=A0A183BR01_GLOPA
MHDKNVAWLSTLLGKYLCDKLVKGKTDSSVDFKKEKSVWTPVAVVKKGDTDLVDPHGFSVRAEKLFKLITNKFCITDLALLQSLSNFLPLEDRGGSGGVFYITKDSKFIIKNLNEKHDELSKMDQVLGKYVQYVLNNGENSMMNRFHLNFKIKLYAKLKEDNKNVIKLKELQFVVLNNTFYGVEPEQLLKFDIKGTFSPGSAESLSKLLPLKDRGGSSGVFYITKDSKYIIKSLNDNHGEPEEMDQVLDKYVEYVLNNSEKSMMNRFHLNFKMTLYAKLRENKMNVIKLKKLQFVVLNNTFYGIEPEKLLKFDIKGTFSPGSAVQYEKNQTLYSKNKAKSPEKSTYREYDFMGIARGERDIAAFFKNGIELDVTEYSKLTEALLNDAQYLFENELNDYSLLLGVHFLDKAPKKNDNNCIHATCRNCKRLPDAVYNKSDEQQHLCLYMAIVDIVTPSTKEIQAYFVRRMKGSRSIEFANIETMADFNAFQLETITPIPAPPYVGRFLGTVLGCIFRPALSPAQANNKQILMNGLSQGICHSFGEERNTFVEKHDAFPQADG